MANLSASASLGLDALEGSPIELRPLATEEDLQEIIRATYKQVLGNIHIMDSQRLYSAEALLRDRSITVRGFVRCIAQSSLYRSLFFEGSSQNNFIELNFKHLLGRAPRSQEEIIQHVLIYNERGYEAEINSYLDSNEYIDNFSEDVIPYPRTIKTIDANTTESFNRIFALLRGSATSDLRQGTARLITSVAANQATPIKAPVSGNGAAYGNASKRYKIVFASSQGSARLKKRSRQEYLIPFAQMNQSVRSIHKSGGKIISITEA